MKKCIAVGLACIVWLLAVGVNADQAGAKRFKMVFFAYDKSAIMPCQKDNLAEQAEYLKMYPGTKIVIEGHADTQGSAEYNKNLSMRRAQAVKAAYVKAGVAADRIACVAKGDTEPAIFCHADTSHRINRRVEVFLNY